MKRYIVFLFTFFLFLECSSVLAKTENQSHLPFMRPFRRLGKFIDLRVKKRRENGLGYTKEIEEMNFFERTLHRLRVSRSFTFFLGDCEENQRAPSRSRRRRNNRFYERIPDEYRIR